MPLNRWGIFSCSNHPKNTKKSELFICEISTVFFVYFYQIFTVKNCKNILSYY